MWLIHVSYQQYFEMVRIFVMVCGSYYMVRKSINLLGSNLPVEIATGEYELDVSFLRYLNLQNWHEKEISQNQTFHTTNDQQIKTNN
jgi:ABC-type microcin C transport system permease subunit YejB